VRLGKPLEIALADGSTLSYSRHREMDAWLHRRLSPDDENGVDGRESVYGDWLQRRLGEAAAIEQVRLDSFRRTRLVRTDRATPRHARVLERPDALLQGVLTVADGDAFAQLLARGVGRHRAYGFGMLLLRRPS
jgi:CRISPR system Cascade subunit CasE